MNNGGGTNGTATPTIKENANPVIFQVTDPKTKRQQQQQQNPIGWDATVHAFSSSRWSGNNNADHNNNHKRTMEEFAVLRALQDTARVTNDKSVSLLQRIGVWDAPEDSVVSYHHHHTEEEEARRRKHMESAASSLDDIVLFTFEQPAHAAPSRGTIRAGRSSADTGTISSAAGSISTSIKTSSIKEEDDENKDEEQQHEKQQKHVRDPITPDEIFDIIRNIQDPEHPLTLEQLGVVSRHQIVVVQEDDDNDDSSRSFTHSTVTVRFTPTIPHCSMATLIGLCIRVKLLRSLPSRFKVTLEIEPGTHQTEHAINKQLADKERVCAALDNKHLLSVVNKCIAQGMMGN